MHLQGVIKIYGEYVNFLKCTTGSHDSFQSAPPCSEHTCPVILGKASVLSSKEDVTHNTRDTAADFHPVEERTYRHFKLMQDPEQAPQNTDETGH